LSLDPETSRVGKTLLAGVLELRSRAFKMILCLLGVFVCLFPFADQVFHFIAQPIIDAMPEGSSLISKQVASPFLTPLRATFWVALFAAMPLLLYHLWKLVDAWLPASKRRVALPFILASAGLFYVGVAFAFFLVLPAAFKFFASRDLAGVTVMTDINAFLSFTLGMVFAFGLAFQVPIIVIIITWTGLVSRRALKSARPYVFLAVFVIAAVLTPPDVFSQTLLAVPMYVLYEIALLVCARFLPDR
ncbi:MAG TPA: twin-arginine translocase subunit TatC, partial [Gammaproteobacteria bacterium]|nr:twin-arginine translocase subunit TatC [Gammaproteobacteria bacterium]